MRELLVNVSQTLEEIRKNQYGKSDYIKTILQDSCSDRISVEISPNSGFSTDILHQIKPKFVSVTWLGNIHLDVPTSEIPAIVLAKKLVENDYSVLLHLTGRNVDKKRMLEILNYLKNNGIKNILALQGDWAHVLEKEDSKCDFPYASYLVEFIKQNFGDNFCVGVAAYPNLHPHSQNEETEMTHLKLKVSKGADFIITQAIFEFESLQLFAEKCRKYDIKVPILPGIFVIKSHQALKSCTEFCMFKVPQEVSEYVETNKDNQVEVHQYGVKLAIELAKKIYGRKDLFAGVHIFSMNDMRDVQNVLLGVTKDL